LKKKRAWKYTVDENDKHAIQIQIHSKAQDDARPDAMIVNVLLVYTIASWLLEF
jgi:hypothetical protein